MWAKSVPVLLLSSLFATACAADADDDDAVASEGDALTLRTTVQVARGAMVLGTSPDGRRVVYGTECDAGDARTTLKLLDVVTGAKTSLAQGVPCAPGTVTFSPDGALIAFGDGMGQLRVHHAQTQKTVNVSRADTSTIGVAFSPSSDWFVVASTGSTPLGSTLDAWDANLTTHVKIADRALFNPFGPASLNIRFSPDGGRLLYLGALAEAAPIGTLSLWDHASGNLNVLAAGVPAGGYAIRDDFQLLAYMKGATLAGGPPSPPVFRGDVTIRNLPSGPPRTVAQGVAATLFGFAGDELLYGVNAASPTTPSATLKAYSWQAGSTSTIDTGVFTGVGPGDAVTISPRGDRIAYTRAFDPMQFRAELRVASGSHFNAARTIAPSVVPVQAYGWLDGGRVLAFLHEATSTFPGATTGTLSAWDASDNVVVTLGSEVTQIGLRIDPNSRKLLFVSSYDMTNAAGDLKAWDARTRETRALGSGASVMSIQQSVDGAFAGFLSLEPPRDTKAGAEPGIPPTKLVLSRITGVQRSTIVARNVTSLSMAAHGRVVFATESGVFLGRVR